MAFLMNDVKREDDELTWFDMIRYKKRQPGGPENMSKTDQIPSADGGNPIS